MRLKTTFLFLFLLLTISQLNLIDLFAQDEIATDDVFIALERRQEEMQTVRLFWTEVRTWPKGTLAGYEKEGDVSKKLRLSLLLGPENRARLTRSGARWSQLDQQFLERDLTTCFNPEETFIYNSGPLEDDKKVGWYRGPSTLFADNIRTYFVPHMVYRPTHQINKQKCTIEDGRELVGETECVVMKISHGNNRTTEFFLDPVRDFLPLRRVERTGDAIRLDLNLSYVEKDGDWEPASWQMDVYDQSFGEDNEPLTQLTESIVAEVQTLELNVEIDEETFSLEFPPGTQVSDSTGDGKRRSYFVPTDN